MRNRHLPINSNESLLTDAQIANLLSVCETDVRASFTLTRDSARVLLDGLFLGIDETPIDVFKRCIWIGRMQDFPIEKFCGDLLASSDRDGLGISEQLTNRIQFLLMLPPNEERQVIDAVIDIILGMLSGGFVLNAEIGEKTVVLLGFSEKTKTYYGNPLIRSYLMPPHQK